MANAVNAYADGPLAPLTVAERQLALLSALARQGEEASRATVGATDVVRATAEALRNAYLEAVVRPGEELPRGEYYWHEVIGTRVVGIDGTELGRVEDVYRAGGAEVFVVRGGPLGEFDLPAVRAFIRIFAPKRGEIVIDAEALELEPPRPRRPRGRRSRRAEAGTETTEVAAEAPVSAAEAPTSPADATGRPLPAILTPLVPSTAVTSIEVKPMPPNTT